MSGDLSGTVSEADKPVPKISIRIARENSRFVRNATTDAKGDFRFAGLPPGVYTLEFSSDGNARGHTRIEVRAASTVHLDIALASATTETKRLRTRLLSENVWYGTDFGKLNLDALPNGRNIWSLLENFEPSTVTNRFNIGGTEPGVPALFSAFGASWTENQYRFNGFDVTDPYQPGLPNINPGVDTLSEFLAVTGSKPAWARQSGESLELASPAPRGPLHGEAALFGSGGILQNDDMNARLRKFDFPGPLRLSSLLDGDAQLGGEVPLWTIGLPFFASISTQQASQDLGGFAAPIANGVTRVLLDLTPWSTALQRVDLLYSGQHTFNSSQGASPSVSPEATTRGNDNYHQFQARWNRQLGASATAAAGFGVVNAIVSSTLQPTASGISTLDVPSLTMSGAAPLATSGVRTRYEGNGILQTAFHRWGSHNLSVGADWSRSEIKQRWWALDGTQQVLVNGTPSELIRWNTPAESGIEVQNVGEFVQDSWRVAKWIVVPLGLRVDTSTGRADSVDNSIHWTTLQPRLGFVVPLLLPGLALHGSWSRYGHVLQGRYFDFGNNAALGAQIFSIQNPAVIEPVPVGSPLRVWGGPYSAVDPHLSRPYTDEISFGVQQYLAQWLIASIRFVRRDDHRLIGVDNIGVPLSDYNPVSVTDPGNDGIYGTADDQVLTLYNENPSALGHDFLLLTNLAPHATYKGFEARAVVHLKTLEMSATFAGGVTSAVTATGNSAFTNDTGVVGLLALDPNTLLMTPTRTYFDRAYSSKITALYRAPHNFYLAMVGTYFDGAPFGRLLFVNGFNQGPFFVRATPVGHPGGFQTQFNASIDARLARDFPLERGTLAAYVDVFNLMNWNSNTQENDLTGPLFLERVPLAVEAPRTTRLGVTWRF